eukprot:TRINITY_DN2088_c0_g2_i1.p1 TRINITY_DN2088_c0_g2~~TRINITY_DN2088_c0_g2_i1.p1  ORF type:complete len:248 (-),score=45.62 TRINITY_DN2088_c0_g2_i1:654-1397(-)
MKRVRMAPKNRPTSPRLRLGYLIDRSSNDLHRQDSTPVLALYTSKGYLRESEKHEIRSKIDAMSSVLTRQERTLEDISKKLRNEKAKMSSFYDKIDQGTFEMTRTRGKIVNGIGVEDEEEDVMVETKVLRPLSQVQTARTTPKVYSPPMLSHRSIGTNVAHEAFLDMQSPPASRTREPSKENVAPPEDIQHLIVLKDAEISRLKTFYQAQLELKRQEIQSLREQHAAERATLQAEIARLKRQVIDSL